MNAQPTRNVFFSYDHDDQMCPIAPCRTIPITEAIRREDAAKQASRKVVITWKPRLSDPAQKSLPKSHQPSKDPRKPATPKRHRPCTGCPDGTISRCNRNGLCPRCRQQKISDSYAEYVAAKEAKKGKKPAEVESKRKYVPRKRNPPPTYDQLRERWRDNAAKRYQDRRAGGRCGHCKEVNDTDKTRCSNCLAKHRENNKRSYEKKKQNRGTA